jgi:CrcB protein
MNYFWVGLGGFLGANARYLLSGWMARRYGTIFPYGTIVINISGSFAIGFFLELVSERFLVHPYWRLFFAVGFLGAYTTFSTFSFENLILIQEGTGFLSLVNIVGSVVLGLVAVWLGVVVSRLF